MTMIDGRSLPEYVSRECPGCGDPRVRRYRVSRGFVIGVFQSGFTDADGNITGTNCPTCNHRLASAGVEFSTRPSKYHPPGTRCVWFDEGKLV